MSASLHSTCDRSIAAAAAAPTHSAAPASSGRWVLLTTILASSLAFIDGSVVNVGLPAIGRSLHEGGAALAWVLNGYLLPLSALLLIGGAAGDLYGRRRLLVFGTGLFAAASLMCALAGSLPWLLAGRVLQGTGAALLMPNSLAILGAAFEGEARGRAIGIWAAVGAAAGAIGPLLGGWLIDAVGWRTIFLINLPIAALAIGLALRKVANERVPARAPLDVAGGLLATIALAGLTWGLTEWSTEARLHGWTLATLAAGGVAGAGFVWVERRRGDRAMVPLSMFGSADFIGLSLLTLLLYGALGGLLVLVPYVLIESHGYSATEAGAGLLPLPLVIAAGSSTMGRIAGRIGARWPLVLGPIVVAGGCLLALRIGRAGYWTTVFPALLVISIGMAAAVAPLTTAVLASTPPQHTGVASGFNSAVARTGGLIATALLGGALATRGRAVDGSFVEAAVAAAAVALMASACAFIWVGRRRPGT